MRRRRGLRYLACGIGGAVLLCAACTSSGSSSTPAGTPTATATEAASTPTRIPTATSTLAPTAIDAGNASTLQETATFTAPGGERLVWKDVATLWVVGTRTVDEVDTRTGSVHRIFQTATSERVLAVSPDGIAATVGVAPSPVHLVRMAGDQPLQTLDPGGPTTAAQFFKGNRVLLVAGDTIGATIWDIGSGQQTGTLSGFQTAAPVYNVVVSNDGGRAAWVSRATLEFGMLPAGTPGPRMPGFEDFIGAYTWLPDAHSFATTTAQSDGSGTPQGRIELWDATTNSKVWQATTPSLPLSIAAGGGGSGNTLVVVGGRGVTLFKAADGTQVASIDGAATGRVSLVSVAPDGTSLVTVADDGTGRIWRPAP